MIPSCNLPVNEQLLKDQLHLIDNNILDIIKRFRRIMHHKTVRDPQGMVDKLNNEILHDQIIQAEEYLKARKAITTQNIKRELIKYSKPRDIAKKKQRIRRSAHRSRQHN